MQVCMNTMYDKSRNSGKLCETCARYYKGSETMVRCPIEANESFKVKVRLHQGSALSPLLFAMIMDKLTDELRRETLWKMLFADDIVICKETSEEVEQRI